MAGPQSELKDHRIPLEQGPRAGLGQGLDPGRREPGRQRLLVRLRPARPRGGRSSWPRTPQAARPLQLAAAIAPDPALKCSAEVVAAEQLGDGRVGDGRAAALAGPAARGRRGRSWSRRSSSAAARRSSSRPRSPATAEFLGRPLDGVGRAGRRTSPVESWRGDQDLLAHTQSGAALPVGQLQVRRYCGLAGEFTPLATLKGGAPLLARVADRPRRRLLLRDHAGRRRFVAGDRRRRPLRPGPAGPGRRGRGPGQHPAARRPATRAGDDPARWKRLAGADGGDLDRLSRSTAASTRRATACWP